jgi:hypothetical protein
LELFRAFSLRCVQIEEAIRLGDDQRVTALDRHVEPLVEAILAYRAVNLLEVYMQLQFVSHLISQDADDSASVTEHTSVLSYLLDRYFGAHGPDWRVPSPQDVRIEPPPAYVPDTDNGQFLNAVILESLPDRVAVLTRDYRYLYSSAATFPNSLARSGLPNAPSISSMPVLPANRSTIPMSARPAAANRGRCAVACRRCAMRAVR